MAAASTARSSGNASQLLRRGWKFFLGKLGWELCVFSLLSREFIMKLYDEIYDSANVSTEQFGLFIPERVGQELRRSGFCFQLFYNFLYDLGQVA